MKFFHHKDLGNHLLQLCPKVVKHPVYRTVNLGVVLYGCETWWITLKDERGLRVFQNRVLIKVFGPKRDEVAGEWIKVHNEVIHDLYFSPNNIQVIK
jgi:hypothetical protein